MALVAKAHRVRERFEVLQNAQQEAAVLRTAHRLLRGRVDTLEAQLVAGVSLSLSASLSLYLCFSLAFSLILSVSLSL